MLECLTYILTCQEKTRFSCIKTFFHKFKITCNIKSMDFLDLQMRAYKWHQTWTVFSSPPCVCVCVTGRFYAQLSTDIYTRVCYMYVFIYLV